VPFATLVRTYSRLLKRLNIRIYCALAPTRRRPARSRTRTPPPAGRSPRNGQARASASETYDDRRDPAPPTNIITILISGAGSRRERRRRTKPPTKHTVQAGSAICSSSNSVLLSNLALQLISNFYGNKTRGGERDTETNLTYPPNLVSNYSSNIAAGRPNGTDKLVAGKLVSRGTGAARV